MMPAVLFSLVMNRIMKRAQTGGIRWTMFFYRVEIDVVDDVTCPISYATRHVRNDEKIKEISQKI